MLQKIFFLLFVSFVIVSCDYIDDSCFATKVDIMEVDTSKFNLKNIDYRLETKVINNLNDYNYYVSDNSDIDFDLSTVILGHFYRNKKMESTEYYLSFLPCSQNIDYYLNIAIKETDEELSENPLGYETQFLLITPKFDDRPIIVTYSISNQ